uniref:Peptidase S1 domain-containing protein n=1 Tax=Haemonchus placei TaxID=6290 RepID=A0A0N4XA60_HAEPC
LTSAHCVIQKTRYWERYCALHTETKHDMYWGVPLARFKIYIGTICTHPELCTEQTLRKAKDIIHHEKYDPCTRENDIAVIELNEDVRREEGTPVCMPEPYEPLDPTLTAIGFGTDRVTAASPHPPTLFNYLQAVDLSLKEVSYARKMIRTKTPRRSVCTMTQDFIFSGVCPEGRISAGVPERRTSAGIIK